MVRRTRDVSSWGFFYGTPLVFDGPLTLFTTVAILGAYLATFRSQLNLGWWSLSAIARQRTDGDGAELMQAAGFDLQRHSAGDEIGVEQDAVDGSHQPVGTCPIAPRYLC